MSLDLGVNGTVCSAEQYAQSLKTNDTSSAITCLTHGQSIGLALTAEASFLSLAAVIIVLALVVRNVLRYRRALPDGDWRLFSRPADIYMICLFAYDILQALGGILDVKWAHDGIVTKGSYCTAQGIIQQTGELGVALITLILTVHTFVTALWKVGFEARLVAFGMVSLACLVVALWVSLGNVLHDNYEAPTPYWCWIAPKYKPEGLAGEYVWIWVALLASVIMYIPLYFWVKGRLSIDPKRWYKFSLKESEDEYLQRKQALGMLLYPLGYSVVVLPLSAVRWTLFNKVNVPSAATFFAVLVFNLSGVINVLLFLVVRRELLLFKAPVSGSEEADLGQHTTGSAIFPDTAVYNHSPQPTGLKLEEDAEDRSWDPTLDRNDVTLSRLDSRPRPKEDEF